MCKVIVDAALVYIPNRFPQVYDFECSSFVGSFDPDAGLHHTSTARDTGALRRAHVPHAYDAWLVWDRLFRRM